MIGGKPLAETAYAKINLALHVRERMPDGYHRIETLFAFCEDGDRLEAAPAETLGLSVEGEFADGLGTGEDNLVIEAAQALAAALGREPQARLRLDKRLPVASGLGGGSADAAATMRLLVRLWAAPLPEPQLLAIAAELGADVPACLRSQTVLGHGRGDELHAATEASQSGAPVLLVNPRVALPTHEVFAAWSDPDRGPLTENLAERRNDLEAPAIALCPEIATVLACLSAQPGATEVRMSGSGATCFALFADAAARDAADAAVAAHAPAWWRLCTSLR